MKFLKPVGADYGVLDNGLSYYAVLVKVGSVVEEDDERGVSCSPTDETIYELLVPVHKPELLSKSYISPSRFRVLTEDLERERGVVFEENRGTLNANGPTTMQDAHWYLMME
ncbi:hypothetical protein MKW98_018994 [Papaver atlanticum]|uniref:Uncharacterized protein n=1 Tax=Papaver atlanticum TaxID=357466 RepID=A0AAD4TG77_9MAGN|nr:hypothetical protein MKW98_018994 [Papaver atlanticum]